MARDVTASDVVWRLLAMRLLLTRRRSIIRRHEWQSSYYQGSLTIWRSYCESASDTLRRLRWLIGMFWWTAQGAGTTVVQTDYNLRSRWPHRPWLGASEVKGHRKHRNNNYWSTLSLEKSIWVYCRDLRPWVEEKNITSPVETRKNKASFEMKARNWASAWLELTKGSRKSIKEIFDQ